MMNTFEQSLYAALGENHHIQIFPNFQNPSSASFGCLIVPPSISNKHSGLIESHVLNHYFSVSLSKTILRQLRPPRQRGNAILQQQQSSYFLWEHKTEGLAVRGLWEICGSCLSFSPFKLFFPLGLLLHLTSQLTSYLSSPGTNKDFIILLRCIYFYPTRSNAISVRSVLSFFNP